jgi:hypothetical protein
MDDLIYEEVASLIEAIDDLAKATKSLAALGGDVSVSGAFQVSDTLVRHALRGVNTFYAFRVDATMNDGSKAAIGFAWPVY